jgi:hypothetical protein
MAKACEDNFNKVITNFIDLFTDIISTANKSGYTTLNPEMVKVANLVLQKKLTGLGSSGVIVKFVEKTEKHWKYVAEKDEKHFATNLPDIVTDIPADYVKEFCKLFIGTKNGKSMIPDEDREAFFESGTELIKIALKYIYINRKPEKVDGKIKYNVNYFDKISLTKYSELFKVKLS